MPITVTMNQDLRIFPNGYAGKAVKAGEEVELPDAIAKGLLAEGYARPAGEPEMSAEQLAALKEQQTERIEAAQNVHVEDPEASAARKVRRKTAA